jgi:hypothetical protein
VKIISESDAGNTSKYWFQTVPFFHAENFPFIICSGKRTFNLINLHTGKMQPLIEGSADNNKS